MALKMRPRGHFKPNRGILINIMIINLTKNSFIEILCEWSQIIGKYNWYSFTLINIYCENETWTGGFEFEFIILGVGLRFRWNYNPKILENMVKDDNYEK